MARVADEGGGVGKVPVGTDQQTPALVEEKRGSDAAEPAAETGGRSSHAGFAV